MNKKQRTAKLGHIIEQTPPKWLTEELYDEYCKKRATLRYKSDTIKNIENIFGKNTIKDKDGNLLATYNPNWGSYSFGKSPKPLVNLYNNQRLFSEPGTGQDPKIYSSSNFKTATGHAGRHWGWNVNKDDEGNRTASNSQWIESGTFNIVVYPNGYVVVEPCNVEHRLWGLIGFPLNLVPIDSDHTLWYYNDKLPEIVDEENKSTIRAIKVNKMFLSDIVKEAEINGVIVTEDEILNTHFYSNNFNYTILPFYSKEECEHYFREVNTSSAKTKLQLHHSQSEPIMNWMKSFASPKCVNFKPMKCNYHPLFELMSESELVKLEAIGITSLVIDFHSKGSKFVDCTDSKLIERYLNTNGYANFFDEDFKLKVEESLDYIYKLISASSVPFKISRQMVQNILITREYIDLMGFVVQDAASFIEEYRVFYKKEQEKNKNLTPFGRDVRSGSAKNAREAGLHVCRKFLKNCSDVNYLKTIGIVEQSHSLDRVFSGDVIDDNLSENDGKDIDGTILKTAPVGGHIISDMELLRLTKKQRDQAAKEENIGDVFDFDKNCRAMSAYHNNRMGTLRLSKYMQIINESDDLVRSAVLLNYNSLKLKPIVTVV
jgi:hypothetical protein